MAIYNRVQYERQSFYRGNIRMAQYNNGFRSNALTMLYSVKEM